MEILTFCIFLFGVQVVSSSLASLGQELEMQQKASQLSTKLGVFTFILTTPATVYIHVRYLFIFER